MTVNSSVRLTVKPFKSLTVPEPLAWAISRLEVTSVKVA